MTNPLSDPDHDDDQSPSQSPSTKTTSKTNKQLDNSDTTDKSDESGRSSPFIREGHQRAYHPSSRAERDGEGKGDHEDEDQDEGGSKVPPHTNSKSNSKPNDPQPQTRRPKHIQHQHGLISRSHSRSQSGSGDAGQAPADYYIGLAFRSLKTEDEVRKYREGLKGGGGEGEEADGGGSKSVVGFERGEELLVWTAVVSDGECVEGFERVGIERERERLRLMLDDGSSLRHRNDRLGSRCDHLENHLGRTGSGTRMEDG